MPKWEIGKTYKTVDGLDAKLIYRTNSKDHPLVFVITMRKGSQFIAERTEQGLTTMLKDKIYRFNVVPPEPDKTSRFVNVCDGSVWGNYSTYDYAIGHPFKSRVGVLEIQFEDGEYCGTVFHPVNKGEDK